MHAPRWIGRILLALIGFMVLPVAAIGLLWGLSELGSFLMIEVMLVAVVPAFAFYVLGFCGPAGLFHWIRKSSARPTGGLSLPKPAIIGVVAIAAIGVGQILTNVHAAWVIWVLFLLAAALPPLAPVAMAVRRLGPATTWRRAIASVIAGSLLLTHLAVLLTFTVTMLAYQFLAPLREVVNIFLQLVGMNRLNNWSSLVVSLIEIALVAPLVEELAKPVATILLAKRLRSPDEAFITGMFSGLGFAIVENMLYMSFGGSGTWTAVAAIRAVGGVLHPLNAGLVATGWYGVRNGMPRAWRRLAGLYLLAVGLHATWNGGLVFLYSDLARHIWAMEEWQYDVYGVGIPCIILVFLLVVAALLWWLLSETIARLNGGQTSESGVLGELHLEQPRRLAMLAVGLVAFLVPLAALYAPLIWSTLIFTWPLR